jgi:branched-chain amino acid transport system ATP-binding protein
LLAVEGLHAHYGKSHILHGVNVVVGEAEIVCLLGRNGVGKSTTLKAIMGLVRPSRGGVVFNGRPLAGLPPHRVARAGLGYVPEERRIFPTISVRENLLMGIKAGVRGAARGWTLERVYEFFPRLQERQRQRAGTLSGGEQQMLTIGRTLMGNPEMLLVDEPTEGLAPLIVQNLTEILARINQRGTALLLVEQTLEVALSLSHRLYVMDQGRMQFDGTPDELRRDPTIQQRFLEV